MPRKLSENMRAVLTEFSRYERIVVRSGARDNRRRNALRGLQRRGLVIEGTGPGRDQFQPTDAGKAVLSHLGLPYAASAEALSYGVRCAVCSEYESECVCADAGGCSQ